MSIKWDLAEKINKAGYDMMTSLEMAHSLIMEFMASGKLAMQYGIMAGKKCVEVVELRRKGGGHNVEMSKGGGKRGCAAVPVRKLVP